MSRSSLNRNRILRWAALGISSVVVAGFIHSPYQLRYNPSESAPRGFYLFAPAKDIHVGDEVFVRLPVAIAGFAAARGYLPLGVPILKRISAVGGQQVCERDGDILIEGDVVARQRRVDGKGRRLILWRGCGALAPNEVFLLGLRSSVSFDSRYFGAVDRTTIIARATPLWTW